MDLGSEGSTIESVEENEVNEEKSPHYDENGTDNNGSFANESYFVFGHPGDSDDSTSTPDQLGNAVGVVKEELAHLTGQNHVGDSPSVSKGFGLKKWRRIRREIVKDPNPSVESKVLKRGLPDPAGPTKNQPLLHDIGQKSENTVISSNMHKNVGLIDASVIRGSSSDSRYVLGPAFALGTDSETSEEISSKSSTATSIPKLRNDMPPLLGYAQENSRAKSTSSKNLAKSTQRVQQRKGRIESSEKPKGERVKMEKENSHSSTNIRSSNFNQGIFAVTTNAKLNGRSFICDSGNKDEAHTNEQIPEVQVGYCNENVDLVRENLAANLPWDVKEGKSENNHSSMVEDPFIDSIRSLQSVQEALEEELQKLGEIRNETLSPAYDSIKCNSVTADNTTVDPGLRKSCLSGQSDIEGIKLTYSSSLEPQVLILTQNVNVLESMLKELQGILALKDSRIVELETALRSGKVPKEESSSTIGLSEEKFIELESELEGFFRQKIEAEIEYLVITKIMQNLKVAKGFQVKVSEEQKPSSKKQAQVLNKHGEAKSKTAELKNQAEELEDYCDVLEAEDTSMMQKRVCKATLCFFVQLMLLIMVFWFFISQLSPNSGVAIPT